MLNSNKYLLVIIGIFSITGIMIFLFNKEERKLISVLSDKINILNSAYQLNNFSAAFPFQTKFGWG